MSTAQRAIPRIGLGTFGLTGDAGLDALSSAISIGYRHLDTAQSYGTEANVGAAIARSGVDRDAFFVTTKITFANFGRMEESVDDSLRLMGLERADLVLIHWPAPDDSVPVSDYIASLARLQDRGRTTLIGVSNFTRRHVDEAIAEVGEGRIATNQFEQHVFLQNRLLADHCRDAGVAVTAYMPLAGGDLGETPVLEEIARRHDAAPSQVALAYLLALGSVVIPKSATPERQKNNFAADRITLDDDDRTALAALERGQRFIDPEISPQWD